MKISYNNTLNKLFLIKEQLQKLFTEIWTEIQGCIILDE